MPEVSHPTTKSRILSAALERLLQQGYEHISMRQIAGDVEITPMAIYKHFASKEALQLALLEAGYQVFENYLHRHKNATEPRERLRQLAQGFFDFAFEQSGYFELIFLSGRGLAKIKGWERAKDAAKPTYKLLHQCVHSCIEEGQFLDGDAQGTTTAMLAFCVGLSALYLSGAVSGEPQHARAHFMQAFDGYVGRLCAIKKVNFLDVEAASQVQGGLL
jgi:AcrR family transcriptional regulator